MDHKQSRCAACGFPLVWGITQAGKRMPLDAEWEDVGVPGKTWIFEGESERIRPYQPIFDTGVTEHYVPHWNSCSSAELFRGGK